uniref:Death domain-containing protein n=1 Tax=Globodera rostochiensis TaxID=31243 RepID=A0A914H4I0_GLORO
MIVLFDATSSKSTEIRHPNSPKFWHQLMQETGISNKQIEQMASEMDKSDSFIEKLSNEENYKPPRQSPKQPAFELKHPGKQSLFLTLLKLDNFYELVGRQEKIAKLVQDLAKTFINIKKLPEIVQSLATIWSEMRRINNGENANEIVQQIVYLWQSVKQNDEFNEYFGNKSEGKNRRTKRRILHGHSGHGLVYYLISAGIIVVLSILVLILYCWRKKD